MKRSISAVLMAVAAMLLAGCAANSTITAVPLGATVDIRTTASNVTPRGEDLKVTSFGNYEFRAQRAGNESFYGILPLKFNGGHLALDILFFAPAALFNLREVFKFYEFDLEKKVVRHRQAETEEWVVYTPLQAEANRSKAYYNDK